MNSKIFQRNYSKTFRNIGYDQVDCMTHYCTSIHMMCHVFSLPYTFDFLHMCGKNFPRIIFVNVINLVVWEYTPLEYDFFLRVTQSFPLLRTLTIENGESDRDQINDDDAANQFNFVVEFPYLRTLHVSHAHIVYIEQLLHYSATHLSQLIEFKINYHHLKIVTNHFTRDATRMNCSKINKLTCFPTIEPSEELRHYFPSL